MTARLEKGGGMFPGIKLLRCEDPLPPLPAAPTAAQAGLPQSNSYTEPYSALLRHWISESPGWPGRLVHLYAAGTGGYAPSPPKRTSWPTSRPTTLPM
jgi:histidinol-phosphate aminotransferase